MVKDSSTEQRILEAARRVFLAKGLAGARMQEIADEAGINKALLHYYFRSKDKLFERIFDEVVGRVSGGLKDIFREEMSVMERLDHIVEVYVDTLLANRYIPLFVINEINNNPERLSNLFKEHIVEHFTRLVEQIQEEAEEGKIRAIHPIHLLINVLGLIIFPFATYPVISRVSEGIFKPMVEGFLEERKTEVKQFIRMALTP